MQWGDVSFTDEPASDFLGPSAKTNINLRKPRVSLSQLSKPLDSNIDSRYVKIKILTQIYKREGTLQAEKEMVEEMKEMQRLDNIFSRLGARLHVTGDYEPRIMNYQCMRAVMDNHT